MKAGALLLIAAAGIGANVCAAELRDLSTDRPDATESPYTVDAGHIQVELDAVRFTSDRHNVERSGTRVEAWSFGEANLKVGLLRNIDLQIVAPAWQEVRISDRATGVTRQRGFGDLTVRLKWNLWGNDGGTTAFALMPFVKIPTGDDDLGNGAVEGGLIVPLAVELPGGWAMGLMAEFDYLEDGDGRGFHTEFVNTITFSHDIIGPLGGFVEFVSVATTERNADWIGQVDLGLTFAVNENVQLDAGVNLGVSRAADDLSTFVGISWRF
jgi:hypothetical protein